MSRDDVRVRIAQRRSGVAGDAINPQSGMNIADRSHPAAATPARPMDPEMYHSTLPHGGVTPSEPLTPGESATHQIAKEESEDYPPNEGSFSSPSNNLGHHYFGRVENAAEKDKNDLAEGGDREHIADLQGVMKKSGMGQYVHPDHMPAADSLFTRVSRIFKRH